MSNKKKDEQGMTERNGKKSSIEVRVKKTMGEFSIHRGLTHTHTSKNMHNKSIDTWPTHTQACPMNILQPGTEEREEGVGVAK